MKSTWNLFLSAAFAFTALTGCDKDDDEVAKANVMVVHASPNAPAVDVRVNDAVVRSNLAYPSNTGYLQANAGATNLKVSPAGTTTYVINANVTLDAMKNYSVFALDSVSKIKAAVVMDDLTAPASGKAHVRFFHLSPNAPAVDIAVASGPVLFPNRMFNDQTNASYTAFTPVNAGTYNLQVKLAGTSTVVLDLPNISLASGKIYTVFAKGFVGGTGAQALGAEIIANN